MVASEPALGEPLRQIVETAQPQMRGRGLRPLAVYHSPGSTTQVDRQHPGRFRGNNVVIHTVPDVGHVPWPRLDDVAHTTEEGEVRLSAPILPRSHAGQPEESQGRMKHRSVGWPSLRGDSRAPAETPRSATHRRRGPPARTPRPDPQPPSAVPPHLAGSRDGSMRRRPCADGAASARNREPRRTSAGEPQGSRPIVPSCSSRRPRSRLSRKRTHFCTDSDAMTQKATAGYTSSAVVIRALCIACLNRSGPSAVSKAPRLDRRQ